MSFQDTLSSIMPVDWLDPYGRTPMAPDAELSVDITIVETDDGIKATSVKNPPKAGPGRLIQAIQEALGMAGFDSSAPCTNLQAADQGKHSGTDSKKSDRQNKELDTNAGESDRIEPSKPDGLRDRDRNPGSSGSRPRPSHYGATEEKDAKEKAG